MGLIRIVEPDQEPLSLEETKLHLRQDLDDDDELIQALIGAVRAAVEDMTLRAVVTQEWRLTLDEWPMCDEKPRIVLPRPPLVSVDSVSYVDTLGATQTLASSNYVARKIETGEWVIDPAYGVTWPAVREQPEAITIEFTCGAAAAAVPGPIKAAMLLMIGHLYTNREAVNVGNIVNQMPLSAKYLLAPYELHAYR